MPFEWSSNWSVGVQSCDRDHQKLFSLINDLHDAMREGKGSDIINLVAEELHRYARSHFASEEALLTRSNYPDLDAHRAEHQKFTKEVGEIRKELAAGHGAHSITVSNFLSDWLQNHIRKSDKGYSAHLNAAGIR